MGRLLQALRIAAETSPPATSATSATSATPKATEATRTAKVASVAGVASPLVSKVSSTPHPHTTSVRCDDATPHSISPRGDGGSCEMGQGKETAGVGQPPLAPLRQTHAGIVTGTPASRLQSIAETHGIDWRACLLWLSPEDIEASRPYLESDDPREYEGIVTWLRVLADPSIVKIPPSTRDSPCS